MQIQIKKTEEVIESKKGELSHRDLVQMGLNFIKFSGPALAIFFQLLANGVPLSKAWVVALYAFYQILSDFLNKWNSETKVIVSKKETKK